METVRLAVSILFIAQGASGVTEIFRERVAVGVYFIRGHTQLVLVAEANYPWA